MASILDQYNSSLRKEESPPNQISRNQDSAYISVQMKEETPIFTKKKMKINLPHDIVNLAVSNNWLICLMSNQILFRLFLSQHDKNDEVSLEKYLSGYIVSQMFFDPSGNHLLISLSGKTTGLSPDLLYVHTKSQKPKKLDRFKDHEITAVAWNYHKSCEETTGSILLGTSRGLIFETELGKDGEKLYYNNWKQLPNYIPLYGMREIEGLVFDLGREKPTPITGLEFFWLQSLNRYIVLATTAQKLFKFQECFKIDENPSLQNIFTAYHNTPAEHLFTKQYCNNEIISKLRFQMDSTQKYPSNFGWSSDKEIYFGKVDPLAESPDFILDCETIKYPPMDHNEDISTSVLSTSSKSQKSPKTFILTEFHLILLYTDHVTAVSLLNYSIVYEEFFSDQYGKLLNIIKDTSNNTIYLYTSKAIFRYNVTNEHRNVWKRYLEKNNFELAEYYAKDNRANLDIVLCQKAEMAFNRKNFLESAIIYSQTQMSFEKVSLKFIDLTEKKPLMTFLDNKLKKLPDGDLTQITMLVVWIVELYLSEISKSKQPQELQRNFDSFMQNSRVQRCVRANRTVIYDLIGSHGDQHNLAMLTTLNKDYESVLNQHINQENYSEALEVLKAQNSAELYYKYCPILMEEIPKETISAILMQEQNLDPEMLMPTLLCINTDKHIQEVIKYLEYAVHKAGSPNQTVHNFLISLYAKHRKDKLETYLEAEGRDITIVHYDVNFALRICDENDAKFACVFLHCLLELWESAVELALSCDYKLAQETASQPADPELKRKLWLKIAEHEIKSKNDVKKALEILKDCDLLKIEDLLPFFPDFEKIDDFKEVICDALKEYNLKIQEQQRDMEDSAAAADRVRNELQTLRNRSILIQAQEPCAICEISLLVKPFFVFPCGHKFHGDCLEKQILPYLNSDESRRLSSLKHQLETTLIGSQSDSNDQQSNANTREKIRYEIENILASDCLYCGIMIDSIDKPFIEDWEQVNIDWE